MNKTNLLQHFYTKGVFALSKYQTYYYTAEWSDSTMYKGIVQKQNYAHGKLRIWAVDLLNL